MSHITTIQTQVKDLEAVKMACNRLGLEPPVYGTHALYLDGDSSWLKQPAYLTAHGAATLDEAISKRTHTGYAVRLPGWRYPLIVKDSGGVAFDNHDGTWGKQAELDRFTQAYAVCKATMEARKKGYQVTEQTQKDGSVRLVCVGGWR